MNKCASLCLREILTARETAVTVVFSLKCWAVGHSWDQGTSGLLSSPPVRLQKWMGQQGGEGSRVLFTNERKAEGEHKVTLNFQSLCPSLLLRRICITCSHHLSLPLQRGLWQKGAVPGPYSAVIGCLLHLICRERQSLSSSCCSCLLLAIWYSCSLSTHAQLSDTTENHWKLDFPSLIPLGIQWTPEHWHPLLRFPSFPLLAMHFCDHFTMSLMTPAGFYTPWFLKWSVRDLYHSHSHVGME